MCAICTLENPASATRCSMCESSLTPTKVVEQEHNDDKLDGAAMGFAPHLKHCPHVTKSSAVDMTGCPLPDLGSICSGSSICGHTKENWICLTCKAVFCGRWANMHMVTAHSIPLFYYENY